MAYLTIGGTDIPVAYRGTTTEWTEVGIRARAFDSTQRSSVRARKRAWAFTSALMPSTQATSIRNVLDNTPPLTMTGDVVANSTSLTVHVGGVRYASRLNVATSTGGKTEHVVVTFSAFEV